MLLVCYNMLNSQNIATYQSINNEKIVRYRDTSYVAKKAAKVAQKKEQYLARGEFYP